MPIFSGLEDLHEEVQAMAVRLTLLRTPKGKDYVFEIPDEWVVVNPLWQLLAPRLVEQARQRIAEAEKPTNGNI